MFHVWRIPPRTHKDLPSGHDTSAQAPDRWFGHTLLPTASTAACTVGCVRIMEAELNA